MCRSPRYHAGPVRSGAGLKVETSGLSPACEKCILASYSERTPSRILGTPSISFHLPGTMGPGRYDGVASVADTVKVDLLPPLHPRKRSLSNMPRSTVVCLSRSV